MPKVFQRDQAQAIMTGRRVSALMRERGVSTASLADSVRIQQSTLANFCAGRRIPSIYSSHRAKARDHRRLSAGHLRRPGTRAGCRMR